MNTLYLFKNIKIYYFIIFYKIKLNIKKQHKSGIYVIK